MKTILFLLVAGALVSSASGQLPWVQTVVVTNACREVPDVADTNHLITVCTASTNFVIIPAGQAARFVTLKAWNTGEPIPERVRLAKSGLSWQPYLSDVIQGPAVFMVRSTETDATLVTLERWRVPKTIPVK